MRPHHISLGVGLLLALACGSGADTADDGLTADRELQLDCLGMSPGTPIASTRILRTRSWDRCVLMLSDTIYEDELVLYDENTIGSPLDNGGLLLVRWGDDVWVSREGSIRLDQNEGDLGAGTFEVLATSSTAEGVARITGTFDWCAFGSRSDCPYTTNGGLEKAVSWQTGDWPSKPETYASECRVLIDPPTGGVQVDLQVGVFNGVNVGLWGNQCEYPYVPEGKLTFRAGGTTGPGTYGPYQTTGHSTPLPHLGFQIPMVWLGYSCIQYGDHHLISTLNSTECRWTIEDDPGRFQLDCEGVFFDWGGGSPSTAPFTLDADCDVRYTE